MAITVYTYNDKVLKNVATDKWLTKKGLPPIPANTIRVKFSSGYTPTQGDTQTLVDSTNNVWDIYKSSNNWDSLFENVSSVLVILGANTSNITSMQWMLRKCSSLTSVSLFDTSNVSNMRSMFDGCSLLTTVPLFNTSKVTNMLSTFTNCTSLTTVPVFDTSNVTTMNSMFEHCAALTSVPLFNTSKVTNISYMFSDCKNVQSGALALYQQASTQTTPPSNHTQAFTNCGSNTTTGAAELAQIPSSWGGRGA